MTPRIRQELKATPISEGGVNYVDVTDPRNGTSFRLYDFEWHIAQRMDGAPLADVARWASGRFGFSPTADDLQVYAEKLAELGFVERSSVATPLIPPPPADDPSYAIQIDEPDETPAPARLPPVKAAPALEPPRQAPRMAEPTPLPPAPKPAPETQRLSMQTGKTPASPEPGRSSALTWVLLLILLGGGGFAVYYYVVAPGLEPAHVRVDLAKHPQEVVRLFDGKGTLGRSEPATLSFGESGKVAEVVAAGTDAKPGMTLASLESAQAVAKELADVKDREIFYSSQLKGAQAKGDAGEAKKFQDKVTEKQKRAAELEEKEKKVRLVAPHGGTVAEVMTTVGSSIKEGDPVLKMVDKRMVATFKLSPGDAAGLKPKQPIAVAPQTGGGSAAAQVVSIDGGEVKVELLDDGGGAVKPGDAVQLVKSRIANVMPTPVTAVVKGAAGADQVFVLSNGVIHTRPVTVTDRTASEAYVSAGLTTGESVVVNPSSTLQDGQKAVVDQ